MKKFTAKTKYAVIILAAILIILLSVFGNVYAENCNQFDSEITMSMHSGNDAIENVNSLSMSENYIDYKTKKYDASKDIYEYIPSYLFITECEQQFVGENYGYFIKTTRNNNDYISKTLLFEINSENVESDNIYKYSVKPVLDEIYLTTDGVRTKLTNRSTYLVLSNLQYYANLVNTHEGNTAVNYNKTKDNGYFIQGAYTEGKYMLLEEDNPYVGMVSSAASYIFGLLVDEIPGASLILGLMDLVGETTDWQSMNTVNNRPHIHYGDYNTQLANNFQRQALLRDGANEPRYIAAKEDQEISFVIEYDNKNRNDVEAEIRNILSFDVYEFAKEGQINLGEVKLNSRNDYENMTISKFNDLELTAIEDKYEMKDNGVEFKDFYTQIYLDRNQTKQISFIPKVDGIYHIESSMAIKCFDGNIELNTDNLRLNNETKYILSITNSKTYDSLCYINVELQQAMSLDKGNDLIEGVNLMPIISDGINAKTYAANVVNSNCSLLVLDNDMQVINSSNIINNELYINHLFDVGNYFIAINNTGDSIVENVDLFVENEKSIVINQEFSRYISNETNFYVKLETEYTALYQNEFTSDIQVMEITEKTFRPVTEYMLFNSDRTYYLKFRGEGKQVSFKMKYTGKEILHGSTVNADAFVNNIYEFHCNLTADYAISGIINYVVLDRGTYLPITVNDNMVRLQNGKSYIIIDKVVNIATNNVKIELIHQDIELGKKTINIADSFYKLQTEFSGIISLYRNVDSVKIYNSNLQEVTNNNITNSEEYYIFADSTVNEIFIAPQVIDVNHGSEKNLGTSSFFKYDTQSSNENRLTISNIGTDVSIYNVVIYDYNFNAIFNENYSNSGYYKDIFFSFDVGQYYIGIYGINNGAKFLIDNKTKLADINNSIRVTTNSERTLYYTLNILKTSIYNFDTNALLTIPNKTIDNNGNLSLTAGTYTLELKGLTNVPTDYILNITIHAENRDLMAYNQKFDDNTIYELTDFSNGSYEFLALGQYIIYDQNLKEIAFNNEIVFNTANQYYIELVCGGMAYYKLIKKHVALTTQETSIKLSASKKYYYAFDNVNMNFLAIACNNPEVIITVYNELGNRSESILATGNGLVFAYSENNIRYVSFQSNSSINSANIRIVDPKANVSSEIYCEQAMDLGQSYFKFTAYANGIYDVTCNGNCSNIEVFDDKNIKMSSYYFEKGRTYVIKHKSTANHTVKIELKVEDLTLNAKNIVTLVNGNNYFEISIDSNYRIFSPTHSLNIYQTKHLDEPIIAVSQNTSKMVPVFSSSSKRIIEVVYNGTANCILYIWRDLEDNGIINYSKNNDAKLVAGSNIQIDVRDKVVFTLPDLYNNIAEFLTSFTYVPTKIQGTTIVETDITLQVRINNRIVDQITKTIKFKIIGTPDSILFSNKNYKVRYNGYDSFAYEIVMKSGDNIVSGYDYNIEQVDGDKEIIVDKVNSRIYLDQDKNLYGKEFRIIVKYESIISNEIKIKVDTDQVIDYRGWYKEDMPLDANNNVILGINSSTKTLRINMEKITQHSHIGLVTWKFNIPAHVKYVEFQGDGNTFQFISINLEGNSIIKIRDMRFWAINSAISAESGATLMIEGEVIIWGNSLLSLYQAYPGIDVNGTLKLILLKDGKLNVKGGMGAWGTDGATGTQGVKGADGKAGVNGATGGKGGTGGNGTDGGRGGVGIKANKIILSQYGNNKLMIEGGMGGQGGNGGTGGKGGTGGADTSWWFCEPGAGGQGGKGGNGGNGGFGGYALDCNNHNIPSSCLVNHSSERSLEGDAGRGGEGGDGGNAGQSGSAGAKGPSGQSGSAGVKGTYEYYRFANEIFGVIG